MKIKISFENNVSEKNLHLIMNACASSFYLLLQNYYCNYSETDSSDDYIIIQGVEFMFLELRNLDELLDEYEDITSNHYITICNDDIIK